MMRFHSLRSLEEAERRREFLAAGLAMLREQPWRFASLLINLALAIFLLREIPREHSPGFRTLAVLITFAITVGNARLKRLFKARRERKYPQEENR